MDLTNYTVQTEQIKYNNIHLISDLHFGVRANSLEWLQNHIKYFREFYVPYLKQNIQEGDILFILGDFFDSRQLLDIYVMNSAIDIVMELSALLPIHFIPGNHDLYKKYDTDVNSIVAFKYIPNVYIYEKPVIVTNGNSKILLLPWIGDASKEEEYVKQNTQDYVFAHTTITGFKMDSNREINHGANFINIKGIKRLFSGHIHKRQEYQQFIYLGSPYHTKRSDIYNQKGVYKFNPTNNTVDFTPNTYSPVFQRIPLDTILELSLDDASKLFNNNYTDIIVPDKYIHLFNLTKFIELLQNCNYKKIETIGERIKLEDELSEIAEGIDIKDILTLLELSITDSAHQMEVLIKLKLLNRMYYEKASRETIE